MRVEIINKTMDRADLLKEEAQPLVHAVNELIRALCARGLEMASWYGTLPDEAGSRSILTWLKNRMKSLLGRKVHNPYRVGLDNRGLDYEALPGAADDGRFPWYLYWESFWVLRHGPRLERPMRLLDAGGASSLFSCYLASLGHEVYSIDLSKELVANTNRIARAMGWTLRSYVMNMTKLDFPDKFFDHAYSVCVFEHLNLAARKSALNEIARCLKPGGMLSLTFDYRNPAPVLWGHGPATREENQLKTQQDIWRSFLSTDSFELRGNREFNDNGQSYLVHPQFGNAPYTFGALFLQKKS